jgi:outer membrane protein OmpA-like peptidoglycan-associated protein
MDNPQKTLLEQINLNLQGISSYIEKLSREEIKIDHSKIYLIGHTDNLGDEDANKSLSLLQANTVKDQLIKFGMPATNIACEGRGSSSPKVNNSTEENRALNRRVEVKVQ